MSIFPRIGWFELPKEIAEDIGPEVGLDPRRNLHGWGIRWGGYSVLFSVKETTAHGSPEWHAFWEAVNEAARPKDEPEVEAKKPEPKRKRK